MNKINKSEVQHEYKQRPVQNFPDYLKYVAKKSKAGFGKVHQELYRLYSESFSTLDKPVPQSPDNQPDTSTENETSKSKVGLRKRWSNASLFWSSTGHDKERTSTVTNDDKFSNNSFVSYLSEGKEDFESSTGSTHNYDTLSDDLEKMKLDNEEFHNTRESDKKETDPNRIRFSMPHSNLTEEAIYTNDRVLYVEKFANLNKIEEENEVENDSSEEYSTPKVKIEQQKSHEIDDYVNLRSPDKPLADMIDAMKVNTGKEIKERDIKLLKRNTIGATHNNAVAKQVSLQKMKGMSGTKEDDDNYYLPPTNWAQSCYSPSSIKLDSDLNVPKIKQSVSTLIKSSTTMKDSDNLFTKDHDDITEDEGVDYVLPSQFIDPDYENIPKTIKSNKISVTNKTKSSSSGQQVENTLDLSRNKVEDNIDYDRPVNWVKSVDKCREFNSSLSTTMSKSVTDIDSVHCGNFVPKGTDNLNTKILKDQRKDSSNGDYSVPPSKKLIVKTKRVDDLYTKIDKGQKRDSSDEDYSVPTFTKLAAKDYSDAGTGIHYSVPRGVRPVNSGIKSASNEKQSIYSVPRSHSIASDHSSIKNQKITGSKSDQANVNANDENCNVEFYNYTVEEVVDCLHDCALTKLANICKEEQLDGEYFRTLKTNDLQREPFNMNWYHISKLFKIIGGWRPKTSFQK